MLEIGFYSKPYIFVQLRKAKALMQFTGKTYSSLLNSLKSVTMYGYLAIPSSQIQQSNKNVSMKCNIYKLT